MKKTAFILALTLLLICCASCKGTDDDAYSKEVYDNAITETITREEFDALENGMSYKEAFDIVGGEGILTRYAETAGAISRSYTWNSEPYGAIVNVMFESGKLVNKEWYDAYDGESPAASGVNYKSIIFSRKDSGKEICLGMPKAEAEEMLGVKAEEGWNIFFSAETVWIGFLDNAIDTIYIDSDEWELNGISAVGGDIDDIKDSLGEPFYEALRSSEALSGQVFYCFNSEGEIVSNSEDYEYVTHFSYGADNTVTACGVAKNHDTPTDITINGSIYLYEEGSGDETLQISSWVPGIGTAAADIVFSGDGAIALEYDGTVFFERNGSYEGRVSTPLMEPGTELKIRADGEWSIKVRQMANTWEESFSGKGDYVTALYVASSDKENSEHKSFHITHDGEGRFTVRRYSTQLVEAGGSSAFTYVADNVIDEEGTYNGDVEADSGMFYFFEIIADGNWTIEPVE